MRKSLEELTWSMIEAARRAGAEAAEAMAVEATSLDIEVRQGALEHAERSEATDIGLRVFIGRRQAVVSASDTRRDTIETMAERAVAMAREAPEDPSAGLADPGQLARDRDCSRLQLADPSGEPDPDELKDRALRCEAAAAAVQGVSAVDHASAGYGRHRVHMAASNGFSGGYERSSHSLACSAITGTGTAMETDHYGETLGWRENLPGPEEVGRIAAERTVARAGARKPTTGAFPVLFDERVAASLVGHLLSAVNGAAIVRGSSWARDLLGRQVLPESLSLIEDPHRPRAALSRIFDAEGLATARRAIVDNGVLTGWTLDLASARRLKLKPTGNAVRSTSSVPSPASWNVALTQGSASRADLIRDMGTGLVVTSMIGSSINPTTGDYSRGASGFWVENGQVQYAVNECTIAGNLRDMLKTLVPANDARTYRSRVVPSLLVEGLTLAGN